MNPEITIEFGTLALGTWFVIDSNGTTFEKTSDREARIVVGNIKLLGIPSQFAQSKPVRVVRRRLRCPLCKWECEDRRRMNVHIKFGHSEDEVNGAVDDGRIIEKPTWFFTPAK